MRPVLPAESAFPHIRAGLAVSAVETAFPARSNTDDDPKEPE